jgi:hypothetical protein
VGFGCVLVVSWDPTFVVSIGSSPLCVSQRTQLVPHHGAPQAFEIGYSVYLTRSKILHDDKSEEKALIQPNGLHPDRLRKHGFLLSCLSTFLVRLCRCVVPNPRWALSFCAVYSTSIRAAVSYLENGDTTGATQLIDPYDTIRVFYAPAMGRIHRSIRESDPEARARCGGHCRACTLAAHADGSPQLLRAGECAGGNRICGLC